MLPIDTGLAPMPRAKKFKRKHMSDEMVSANLVKTQYEQSSDKTIKSRGFNIESGLGSDHPKYHT